MYHFEKDVVSLDNATAKKLPKHEIVHDA